MTKLGKQLPQGREEFDSHCNCPQGHQRPPDASAWVLSFLPPSKTFMIHCMYICAHTVYMQRHAHAYIHVHAAIGSEEKKKILLS
jgi:hypothetical protein